MFLLPFVVFEAEELPWPEVCIPTMLFQVAKMARNREFRPAHWFHLTNEPSPCVTGIGISALGVKPLAFCSDLDKKCMKHAADI